LAAERNFVPLPKIWVFVKSQDGRGERWQWRELLADGTIVRCSEDLTDYGKTVHNAIRSGFDPLREYWLIKSSDVTTYYQPSSKLGERQSNVPPLEIREALRKVGLE
jgi:hypothetical protein